jgi:hypothetical protein
MAMCSLPSSSAWSSRRPCAGWFTRVIEGATGRKMIGFMSGNQQDPDLMCEVFILAPTVLVDEDELEPEPDRLFAGPGHSKAVHPS